MATRCIPNKADLESLPWTALASGADPFSPPEKCPEASSAENLPLQWCDIDPWNEVQVTSEPVVTDSELGEVKRIMELMQRKILCGVHSAGKSSSDAGTGGRESGHIFIM